MLKTKIVRTCQVCGFTGEDIHEYPTYRYDDGDTTELQCDDYESCLDRKLTWRNV